MKSELTKLFSRAAAMLLMMLLTTTSAWAKDFSGGELYTLQEFQYGKFEARMKMAAASGTVSSMFLYQDGCEIADGRPWVEVDMEVLGKNPGSFQSNIITGKAGAQKTSERHHAVSPAADLAFHTYAIEWTPNYVRWTVDGVEVRKTETDVNDNKNQVANLIGTQGLRFNLWSSESAEWVGAFDESALPLFQFINWVKVYKYTPGQGDGGSDFTLDWTDNFDTFDGSRWGKGDWTFDGNRVDLTDKNIYCQDGMLILALTRKGQENFNGSVPDDVVASGYCGDPEVSSGQNVTWKLTGDGVLTISGTGAMANYDSSSDHPWSAFHSDITTAVIGDGVTSIGRRAFADCANLTSVTLPAGVEELGDDAFEGYNANLIIYVPLDEYENYCNNWPAYADIIQPIGAIPYIAADGTKQYCADFIELTGSEDELGEGTYLVNSDITYTQSLNLTGDVTLILADNCHMNVGTSGERISGEGISPSVLDANLTITSESLGSNMGALGVYNTGDWTNAIVANALTINGGNVTADTDGDGAPALYANDGDITINGGTVTATTAGTDARALSAYGNFNYNGGNVTATAPNANAILADGNYTFSWRTPADRITIGATGLYAPAAKTATFSKAFTDGTTTYSTSLTGDELSALSGVTLYPYIENLNLAANLADGNYWTTFYYGDTNYKIDEGEDAWAYTAEYDAVNSQLTLQKLGKVIPKNTAVIIVGADASIDMTALCNAVAEYSVGNNLRGVDVRTEKSTLGSGTFYVLGKQNDDFGFYRYTAQYMPARKAYLLVSGSAAPGLKMVFDDETTSLTPNSPGLSQGEGSDYWYTLSGTRLNAQPTQKGIYIVNGKKVVIK